MNTNLEQGIQFADEILSSILQVIAFTLIPLIVYLIRKKTFRGFWASIGLKKSPIKANLMALGLTVLIFIVPLILVYAGENFRAALFDPKSVTGKFRAMGFSTHSMIILFFIAFIKTALSEEILFRGFLAKILISWLGFVRGNILQAFLFGIMHSLIFLSITTNFWFLLFIFLMPGLTAYAMAWLNEKQANGSIIPSWIAHGTGNFLAYTVIGFLV